MSEQTYIIENQESFELKDIFECGQCFRWNRQIDGSYTGVIKDAILNVRKDKNRIVFSGNCFEKDLEKVVREYFDLDTNYDDLKAQLAKVDENLRIATKFGKRN